MPPDHNLDDYVDPYAPGHRHGGPLRVGLGGPVGSGKTALAAALCRTLGSEYDLAVVTNDIYTTEDADFLRRNAVLPDDRIEAVQTGCCPHTAIRDDITANLDAVDLLVVNKTDLAPLVGADLDVMRRDSAAVRGGKPTLLVSLREDPTAATI